MAVGALRNRWLILTASVISMVAVANLQYGRAFDFRADIMLLIGGLLVFFTLYVGPAVFRFGLSPTVRTVLYALGGLAVLYGLALTVVPDSIWTPFAARWTVPNIGWGGVFTIAAIFDVCAALIAFFILRKMRVPEGGAETKPQEPQLAARTVPAGAAD
jgi:hypothetical protein